MKNWIIYFLCVAIGITSVPMAADKMMEDEIPTISICSSQEITEINIEDFALKILIAEKPKNPQSTRALAIAARSIGAYMSLFGCKHEDFDVCNNGDCCFALGEEKNSSVKELEQYQQALNDTYGTVLTIDELPALALFCQCAGSGTGNSEELIYLKSVEEENICQEHITKTQMPYSALFEICNDEEEIKTNSILVYEANQKCDFAIIGGIRISGAELRNALDAASTELNITFDNQHINIICQGNGHGYGMSLCGAENMAKQGKNFEEILNFYYPYLILNKIYHN